MSFIVRSVGSLYHILKETPPETLDYKCLKRIAADAKTARLASSFFIIIGALCISSIPAVMTTFSSLIWFPTAIGLTALAVCTIALSILFHRKAKSLFCSLTKERQLEIFYSKIISSIRYAYNNAKNYDSDTIMNNSFQALTDMMDIDNERRPSVQYTKDAKGPLITIKNVSIDKNGADLYQKLLLPATSYNLVINVDLNGLSIVSQVGIQFVFEFVQKFILKWFVNQDANQDKKEDLQHCETFNKQLKYMINQDDAIFILPKEKTLTISTKYFDTANLITCITNLNKQLPQLCIKLCIPPLVAIGNDEEKRKHNANVFDFTQLAQKLPNNIIVHKD